MTQAHQLCALRDRIIFVDNNPAAFAKLQEALAELGVQSPEFDRVTVKPALPFNGEQVFCIQLPSEENAPYLGMSDKAMLTGAWSELSAEQLAKLRDHGVCRRISRTGAPRVAGQPFDVELIAGKHGFAISNETEVNVFPAQSAKTPDTVILFVQLPDGVTV